MTSRTNSTYDGAELKTRSSRPGAYNAFEIPSLMFGKQKRPVIAEPAPTSLPASTPTPTPVPTSSTSTPRASRAAKGSTGIYRPQPGSVGDQVITHLQKHGGTLTTRQIVDLCGVERESVAGLMQRARATGAVDHEIRDRKGYYFLPAGPTEAAQPSTEPAATSTPAVEASTDRRAQALKTLADSTEGLTKAVEQLQAQTLFVAKAIQQAIANLQAITRADLEQA